MPMTMLLEVRLVALFHVHSIVIPGKAQSVKTDFKTVLLTVL
jgi:hypothetical protein